MIGYEIDAAARLIRTRMTGVLTYGDVALHLQTLLRDPQYDPTFSDLVRFCPGCMPPGMEELLRLGELAHSAARQRPGVRWAVVIPDEFRRSLATVCLGVVPTRLVNARVFPTVPHAEEWLGVGAGETPDDEYGRDDVGNCAGGDCGVDCFYSEARDCAGDLARPASLPAWRSYIDA